MEEKNGPIMKERVGRFQVSVWKRKKVIKPREDVKDFVPERVVEEVRACVQYSRFNKRDNFWSNQSIWCRPEELRNLAQVLDRLNGGDESD